MQGRNDEWCEVVKIRAKKINPDKVCFSVRKFKTKKNNISTSIVLHVGCQISDLLGWKAGDYVQVRFNILNPKMLRVAKSDSINAYKLSANTDETVLRIDFNKPNELKIDEINTVCVSFDLLTDKTLLVDLSKTEE
jgi:hypothetical protein